MPSAPGSIVSASLLEELFDERADTVEHKSYGPEEDKQDHRREKGKGRLLDGPRQKQVKD
jgi:hypothetical protein